MIKLRIIIALLFLSFIAGKAQNRQNRDSFFLELSINKICIGYQHHFDKIPFFTKAYIGVANQDINTEFDDILLGIKLKKPVLSFKKSNIYGEVNTGIYFPNNKYYKATTLFAGVDTGYEVFIGEQKNHILFTEIGYVYGQKGYIQTYENELLILSTKDEFKLSPITFTVGYGYNF